MSSGFRFVVTKRDTTKLEAYLLAIAVQMILVPPLLLVMGVDPIHPSFFPVGAVVGGLLFGASMSVAGGCAAGVWFKLGGGSLEAGAAVLGMIVGAASLEVGPLAFVRRTLHSVSVPSFEFDGALAAVSVVAGLVIAGLLMRAKVTMAGDWTWRRTGLLVGLTGVLAWPLSIAAGRPFGMAVIPGAVSLLSRPLGVNYAASAWDLLFVVGVPLGGLLAVRGRAAFTAMPTLGAAARRFAGGLGLGLGASLAAGCTVGHGLTGLPLFAPGSAVTMLAIFAGSVAAPVAAAWRQKAKVSGRA
ncbi:MAG: YeeE/YedE family protein [Deltaproteobacteria bacterium]|jgi:uncharacterized membrane protein YedE/YeeE